MSRDQLFAITFFGNVCGQPHLLRRLIACISKSDRKMSTARHFALNGNPPLGACIRRRAYIRNDQSISEWWAYTRGGGLYIRRFMVYNFAYFILESVLFDVPRAVYRLLSLNTN